MVHPIRIPLRIKAKQELRPLQRGAVRPFSHQTLEVVVPREPELPVLRPPEVEARPAGLQLAPKGRERRAAKGEEGALAEIGG